jgi:hypothetical protein
MHLLGFGPRLPSTPAKIPLLFDTSKYYDLINMASCMQEGTSMTDRQRRRPTAVATGEGGELAGQRKLAAALNATSNLPTNVPGISLS